MARMGQRKGEAKVKRWGIKESEMPKHEGISDFLCSVAATFIMWAKLP